ncbi:MrcB family domain-containing protein [Parasphingorhabdus flavimaris]|uniref:MrcB family domain-containing protein n=1 Tax=Parasphingorhabdus flavimaris TaxID=266812 RepID=UPI003001DEDF
MSRYNPYHQTAPLLNAVEVWAERCLLGSGSILAPKDKLWTSENLDQLDQYFVQNLDEGEGNFLEKLRSQLGEASNNSIKLMAEIMWLLMIFPSNIGSTQKRLNVSEIWSWSGENLEVANPMLSDDVFVGVGSAGIGYNNHRWRELVFIISSFRAWKKLAREEQVTILSDGWLFIGWLEKQPGAGQRQLSHILPHLLFPDTFERISSSGDKIRILSALYNDSPRDWKRDSQINLDRALLEIRKQLEAKAGAEIDFYSDDIKALWSLERAPASKGIGKQNGLEFATVMSEFLDAFGSAREGPFTTVGRMAESMNALREWLEACAPVASRKNVKVKISVGQGNWTRTPWIALLDERITTSTQRGFYIVLLVADDLSVTYLTLNQGMTELVSRLGQKEATEEMLRFAEISRSEIGDLLGKSFELDNKIDLQSHTSASSNYEAGTIVQKPYRTGALPNDETVNQDLELLLSAFEKLIAEGGSKTADSPPESQKYGVADAINDLFLNRTEVEEMLEIWRGKKNLILQGAPGVGKSYISRRLAYCLLGEKDPARVSAVQFHQSYSYEDFVRGFRPNADGNFSLQDGIFYKFCSKAANDPDRDYVLLIDEINRGNLSKIMGELMLLVEGDKRERANNPKKEWTVQLAYSHPEEQEFWVPDNLFILGMMNTADRSLSLVDYALRRRFAFADLSPQFGSPGFLNNLQAANVPLVQVENIVRKMEELNAEIGADRVNLGPGFCVGHSFFVPQELVKDAQTWFARVVRTEIYPLLQEYWFDEPTKAEKWRDKLLAD